VSNRKSPQYSLGRVPFKGEGDKHAKAMLAMARDVNTVWNFCNETQYRSLKRYCNRPKVWLSGFDP
jgi:hypothetical protein